MPTTAAQPLPSPKIMRWCRAFSGKPDQAGSARAFVGCLLADSSVLDNALQVSAELVANAICHSRSGLPGGLFTVELCRWRGGVAIAVSDQGDRAGIPAGPIEVSGDPLAEHGNGLRIVDALADSWRVRGGPHGRTVSTIFVSGTADPLRGWTCDG